MRNFSGATAISGGPEISNFGASLGAKSTTFPLIAALLFFLRSSTSIPLDISPPIFPDVDPPISLREALLFFLMLAVLSRPNRNCCDNWLKVRNRESWGH